MADSLYVLNEADLSILQGIISRERMGKTRPPYVRIPAYNQYDSTAPEVYVALTPPQGIPAISGEPGTGTHITHAESGTGTGFRVFPGSESCKIYFISPSDTDKEMIPIGIEQIVYNLSQSSIPGGIFTPIARDKSGSWLALPPATVSTGSRANNGAAVSLSNTTTITIAGGASSYITWDNLAQSSSQYISGYSLDATKKLLNLDGSPWFYHHDVNLCMRSAAVGRVDIIVGIDLSGAPAATICGAYKTFVAGDLGVDVGFSLGGVSKPSLKQIGVWVRNNTAGNVTFHNNYLFPATSTGFSINSMWATEIGVG